ncbi:MAG: hypothetical protein JSR58_01885 [Verrucomicrobia bacterium]|nr:hypothetical protein [Verrucomicrobiota bacterium]
MTSTPSKKNLPPPSTISSLKSKFLKGFDALFFWKASSPLPMHPLAKAFLDKHGCFAPHALLGWVTDSDNDKQISFQFLEKIADWPLLYRIEFLAKVIALRSLQKGDHIPLEDGFTVDHVFWLAPDFPAFGLQGQNTSILLFRGTDFRWKGRASIWADLDLRGPGFGLYQKNRSELRAWLKGRQAWATGFSLGGALAAYAALYEPDLLLLPSLAFNAPGVYRASKKKTPAAQIVHYVNKGDPVSKVGTLIGEVHKIAFPRPLRPIEAHVTPMLCLYNQ